VSDSPLERRAALRRELRAYFRMLMTAERRAALRLVGEDGDLWRELVARIGADGWLRLGWPAAYGGDDGSPLDQYLVVEEAMRAEAPYPFVTTLTVAPSLIAFGTETQRRRFLPAIFAGELLFAIGYTEPDAGTDLASLRTRAARDGDDWIINGAKVFTSGAGQADYIWLACRTNPQASRHGGISIIVVPTSSPGFSWTPIQTVGDIRTTATYYEDLRVPAENLVGPVDDGWRLITQQLTHERAGLAAWGGKALQGWDETVAWASEPTQDGRPIDAPWLRIELARTHVWLEAMSLLNLETVTAAETSAAQAAVAKVFGTEVVQDSFRVLASLTGEAGTIRAGAPGAVADGRLERGAREGTINTFGGGVNEVLRDLIAVSALGLPRGERRSS
jgi:alkylation response protein AidB-like acyl-CoA dehydrogenase